MEFVQAILSAIGAFFSGVVQLVRLWVASTDDAATILTWFAFAVALTISLALVPRLMNELVLVFDRGRSRPLSLLLTTGPLRVVIIAGLAILLAASAAAFVGAVLTEPA